MRRLGVVMLMGWMFFALPGKAQRVFYVQLKDKKGTPYTLQRPTDFLSERSLERRRRQGIALDEGDLPVSPAYLDSIRAKGGKVLYALKWHNGVTVQVPDSAALQSILALPFVENAEARRKRGGMESKSIDSVQDAGFGVQYLDANQTLTEHRTLNTEYFQSITWKESVPIPYSSYGMGLRQMEITKGDALHHQGYRGRGKLIAVLDAGFYRVNELAAFAQLRDDNRIVATRDFIDSDRIYSSATHGMQVLSLMAAWQPGLLIGTAPEASYALIRTENEVSEYPVEEDAWIAGAEYADSLGADFINSSLGYTTFDSAAFNHTFSELNGRTLRISRAAGMAAKKGIIVVNSAGNDGHQRWRYIGAPADAEGILAVGAADTSRKIAYFSSLGPAADGRVKPEVTGVGHRVLVINADAKGYAFLSGTSLAAPLITGQVACLWEAFPEKTSAQIIEAVKRSGDHYYRPDSLYGHGIPDFLFAYRYLENQADDPGRSGLLQLFPNPFREAVHFYYFSPEGGPLLMTLHDAMGRTVLVREWNALPGERLNVTLDGIGELPDGFYFATFKSASETVVRKLVKDSGRGRRE